MKRTWEALDDAERVGQLFNLRSVGFDTEEIARRRLPEPQVTFARAELPQGWPAGHFDLTVFSEVLYYFTRAEIDELAGRAEQSLRPGGQILLVNWLGETGEPLSGREAAELFLGACCESVPVSRPQAGAPYRVDLLTRTHRTS
ncbi:methyltransferase family protein [Allosediminivita pacifica]|uniref:Methyltransferase family protein n=1 Tax=Allosediminivita pacifica TaxID=1267769 RepID=A0A2T6A024_9RHOB|nr:methyltransferase family protein [Allosediminivita pacifica]